MDVFSMLNALVIPFWGNGYNPISASRTNFWQDFMRYLVTGAFVSIAFAIWFYLVHAKAAARTKKGVKDPADRPQLGNIPSPTARTYKKAWLIFILLVMLMFYSLIVADLPHDHNVRNVPANVQQQYSHSLNIYVYGQQWQWQYYIPKYHIWYLYQANMPADTIVHFHVTSRDVMHDWTVPAFKIKVDAFPGHWNTIWTEVSTPGQYMAECMEYCGIAHYLMRSPMTVMTYHNFTVWAQKNAGKTLVGAYGPYVQEAGIQNHVVSGHNTAVSNQTAQLINSHNGLPQNKSNNTFAVLKKNLNMYGQYFENHVSTDAHRVLQTKTV